jgi:hypothetical protein
MGINSCGRSKHLDCFDHGYLEEEKLIIPSFTVTFGAKYYKFKNISVEA